MLEITVCEIRGQMPSVQALGKKGCTLEMAICELSDKQKEEIKSKITRFLTKGKKYL